MIERLEVAFGPGTVIRYGNVAAWAGPAASANLVSFLAESARNLAPSAVGGDQLADHLAGVLGRRDPEPDVAFVAVGPGEDGWTALLHGPVQVWDGSDWTAPEPERGWLRTRLWPRPALSVSVTGTPSAPPSPDSMLDLEAGVVPGSGFVLVPVVAAGREPAPFGVTADLGASAAGGAEETTVLSVPDAGPPTMVLPLEEVPAEAPEAESAEPAEPGSAGEETEAAGDEAADELDAPESVPALEPRAQMAELLPGPLAEPETADGVAEPETAGGDPEPSFAADPAPVGAPARPEEPAPHEAAPPAAGRLDLRAGAPGSRVVPYPPLPPAGDPPRPVAGAPVVAGTPCPRGHLNRPGMQTCARCGRPITGDQDQVSGTRPALGCLVTDEGAVYRLDFGYLVGSDPARDPTVRGRLARALELPGDDVAASHAEIRLHDWDVVVTDRASEGGTHVFEPGAPSWERIRPYDPRVLRPGTHLAFGQRVATFLTPWNI